ncbi:MAG: RraA family protein [Thermoguttaceae bacterium]|nr:RraA family protein [Thermoguttaceae bacterium]
MPIAQAALDLLAQFDTPTICNAIELYGILPQDAGFMDSRIRACFPTLRPMVGYAATATFRASFPPPPGGGVYAKMVDQVCSFDSLPGPAVVVIDDLDNPPVGAVFGEVMCSTYRAFGAVGLVSSGAGRDLEQVAELRFPVFTGATICSHGYPQLIDVASPVRIGGLVVRQGDLLHGDANGVTSIPMEIAAELPEVAAEFADAERIMLDYLQGPEEKRLARLAEARTGCAAAIDRLRQRVRRHP